MRKMLLLGGIVWALAVGLAHGTQPECTGNRHYDEAGQCCPIVDVPSTTTTTLPQECPPQISCPDPAPCPTVTCKDGSDGADGADGAAGSTTIVQVDRCPAMPIFAPCRLRKTGHAKPGDVIINGRAYNCPRNVTPRRFFVPQLDK